MTRYLLFILCFAWSLEAASLKAILVVDTMSDIGREVHKDLTIMTSEVKQLSHHLNIPLQLQVLTGRQVTAKSMFKAIEDTRVRPDDIIIFFYSGHGFRDREKTGEFPYFHFLHTEEAIDMDLVIEKIQAKNARFNLVISDACNNFRDQDDNTPDLYLNLPRHLQGISTNLRPLFFESRGTFAISSSAPGQISWGSERGGYFILSFINSLHTQPIRNWNVLFHQVKRHMGTIQQPVCKFL